MQHQDRAIRMSNNIYVTLWLCLRAKICALKKKTKSLQAKTKKRKKKKTSITKQSISVWTVLLKEFHQVMLSWELWIIKLSLESISGNCMTTVRRSNDVNICLNLQETLPCGHWEVILGVMHWQEIEILRGRTWIFNSIV